MFGGCASLTSVSLPYITSDSYGMFKDCDNLLYVDMPRLLVGYDDTDLSMYSTELIKVTVDEGSIMTAVTTGIAGFENLYTVDKVSVFGCWIYTKK